MTIQGKVCVALLAVTLCACGNDAGKAVKATPKAAAAATYDATLADGIAFGDHPGYPRFVSSVTGMSGFEPGNRWTEGPKATFNFAAPLPTRFVLKLELVGAFGPNVGKPVLVRIGDWQGSFTVETSPKLVELPVQTGTPAQAIEFTVPEPRSPKELGVGTDTRQVGIGFRRLAIVAQ